MKWIRVATLTAVVLSFGLFASPSAMARQPEAVKDQPIAAIYQGDCTPGEFVNPVARLKTPQRVTGDAVGSANARSASASTTKIDFSLEDILSGGHVVTYFALYGGERTLIACGALGGVLTDDGSLNLVLEYATGVYSGQVAGIAILAPSTDGGTTVTMIIADPRNANSAASTPPS